jgi:TonB family protein
MEGLIGLVAVCACLVGTTAMQTPKKAQHLSEVPATAAATHIVAKVEPEYPGMAKSARLQGTVVLKAIISPEGNVTRVGVVSGNPLLTSAAVSAVRKWQYKPFIVNGHRTAIETTIEVPFSLGIPEAEYKKEQQTADAYFKQEDECRRLVIAQRFADAEPVCKTGVELVEKLPRSRGMERITAYQQAGHSMFYQKKFSDAVKTAKGTVEPYSAELGYAYHHLAASLHATGDLTAARSLYEQSESTLELAREHIRSEFLKNRYSAAIKSVLADYVVLLRQIGDESGAQAAAKKASSIVIRTELKDD